MRQTLLVLVAVTITYSAHVSNNKDSSVLVTYEGHAEAVRPVPKLPKPKTGANETKTGTGTSGTKDSTVVVKYEGYAEAAQSAPKQVDSGTNKNGTSKSGARKRMEYIADSEYMEHKNINNNKPCNKGLKGLLGTCGQKKPAEDPEVVFIPSGNQDEGEYTKRSRVQKKEEVKLKNIVERHSLADIVNNRVVMETESPQEGVLFISGKNNEYQEETIKKEEEVKRTNKVAKESNFKQTEAPLDCKNLNCDNNLASLCGVKKDSGKMKYRLFLNECYYRKVNCAFTHPENRYSIAPSEKCVHIGSHSKVRQIEFSAYQQAKPQKPKGRRAENVEDTRRNYPSRRALSTGMEGRLCDHECPDQCTEDYAPVCAVSGLQGRMFLNHCQMDMHSCVTGTVWQIRPTSDCVGQKKADVHNNREFIGWMQRLGVIDGKGKIVIP